MSAAVPWYYLPQFRPARLQDCVLWLESDSFSGSIWRNLAPSYTDRNHGAAGGGVGLSTWHPQFSPAPTFYGDDEHLDVPDDDSLDATDAVTIEAWVNGVYSGASKGLLDKGNSASAKLVNYYAYFNSGQGRFYIGDGTNYNSVFTSQLTDYQWYHITFTLDADYLESSVNGEFCEQTERTINPQPNNQNLLVGTLTTAPRFLFHGIIPLVRIYKAALTPAEVMHNYTHHPLYYLQRGIDPYQVIAAATAAAAPSI